MESISKHIKGRKVTGSSQQDFNKGQITQDQPDSPLQCVGWLSVRWKNNEYCLSQLQPHFQHYILLHPHRQVQVKYG